MGVKVSESNVFKGQITQNKAVIFPGYNGNDSDFIKIIPGADKCARSVTVFYDTNFAIVATDASNLSDLIDLAKGVIPAVTTSPTANTIINGVEALNGAINKAVDTEKKFGMQEFQFVANPCPESEIEQCFEVKLTVFGQTLITDADEKDDDEQAILDLTLSAKGATASKHIVHKKNTNAPIQILAELKVSLKSSDPFLVYAKLDEFCQTDGPGFIGGDSVSLIKIDAVQIIVGTIPCEVDEIIELPTEKNKIPKVVIGENALRNVREAIKKANKKE